MPLVLRPPGTRPLPERLADLGRARRAASVLAAGFAALTGLTLLVLTACLLDAAFGLPPLARAALLSLILTTAGVCWLRVVRPAARQPVKPLAVALKLETEHPRLNDALASAIAFEEAGRLSRFQEVAKLRATNLADRLDLDRAVPSRRAWGRFWLLALVAAATTGIALLSPPRTAAAVRRLADPFGGHAWPTRTAVELVDAPTLLAAGDPYPLRFRVSGLLPATATVVVRLDGGQPVDEVVPVPEDGLVSRPLDPGRVARDFAVRVTAGDGDTGWLMVEVAPPPKLVPTGDRPSPQVSLVFPAYTQLPPAALPDGTGLVEGVTGTRVRLTATADRPIASAALVPQFDLAAYRALAAVAPLAADHPLAALGAELLAPTFAADIPVTCRGTQLDADFVPPLAGLYALRFTDARGLTGNRLIDFRLFADPPPVVALDKPATGRDPLDLLPTAKFPLAAVAEDRPFAVRWLAVEYRVGADGPVQRLPLVEADADQPAAIGGGLLAAVPTRSPLMAVARTLPVSGFTRPDGSPPADGDSVFLRAAAADWDDRTALKEPGRSPEVELRVSGRQSLEAKFQKELAGLRPDLLRLREELRNAKDQPDTLRSAKAKLDDPATGLVARTDRLRQTKKANNLTPSPTTDKVESTAEAAKAIGDKLDAGEVAEAEAAVDKLLEKLEQWAGAGEVRGEARAIQDQVQKAGEQADAAAASKAEREKAADKLDRAADQAAGLVGKAGRLAVEKDAQAAADKLAAEKADGEQADALRAKAEQAAAEADALRKSVKEAGGEAVADDLRQAADELRKNRPGDSADARRSAAERLSKLADPLAEPTPSTAAGDAEKLAKQQDELRKKVKQAEQNPDLEKRAEELQKLAGEQQKLKEEADKLAERLTREKNEPAAQAARDAAGQLAAAGEQLQRAQAPTGEQAEAEKKLDEVKKQLDAEKKPPEEVAKEKRADLADKLKAIRDRQQGLTEGAVRLCATAAAAKRWDRPLQAALGEVEEQEAALAAELRPLAAAELAELPVFAKLAAQAADAMTLAGKRAAARRDDVGVEDVINPAADERVLTPMRTALRKLDQIIAAVAPAPGDGPKPDAAPMPEGQPPGDQPMGGEKDGKVSPLAQLKALRAMQAEVAEQTAAFAREHPDVAKLGPDDQAELAALEQTQRDIFELFQKLAAELKKEAP